MSRKPGGKALHDVVAAVLVFHHRLADWVPGKPYRRKGEWGWKYDPVGPHYITISLRRDRFLLGLRAESVNDVKALIP